MLPSLADYASSLVNARTYENQILYRMCKDVPQHDDPDVNAGKVILIGRTYAASPQRGAGKPKDAKVNFFDAMGDALKDSRIDVFLNAIDPLSRIDDVPTHSAVLKAHGELVEILHVATKGWAVAGVEPRKHPSFASKYLHFHRPNAFPLMGSRAKEALRKLGHGGIFNTYESFCLSVLAFAESEKVKDWTPRQIDGKLLGSTR